MTDDEQREIQRQNILIKQYLDTYVAPDKQKQMLETFSMSEIRYFLSSISVEFFAQMYFPEYFSEEFGDIHHTLFSEIKRITKSEGTVNCICCPRSVGKSTCMSFVAPLYVILFKLAKFVLIVSANESTAAPFLTMIKEAIENNKLLTGDFGDVKAGSTWNNEQANITSHRLGITACIMIRGINSSFRGCRFLNARPDLVLLDDAEASAKTDADIDKVTDAFSSVILPIGSKSCNYVVVGTVLSENDMMSQMLDGRIPGVHTIKAQAIEQWSDSPLWEQWQRIYTDISNTNHLADADAFYNQHKDEMLKGTKVLWEHLDYYWLMKKKLTMQDSKFWCEYQNEPRNSSNYVFSNIQYWDKLPDINEMRLIMYVDPAIQIKKQSDNSAICILAEHKKTHQFFVVDGSLVKLLPDDLFKFIYQSLHTNPTIDKVYFESNQSQSYLADRLQDLLFDKKDYTSVEKIYNSKKKEDRILALEPFTKNGIILFNKNNIRFNEQVINYCSTSVHDDAPDALAGAFAMMKKPQSIQFFDITF